MLPRLKTAPSSRAIRPGWPPYEEGRAAPVFLGRQRYRKLAVLLDADVIPEADLSTWGKAQLLAGLLTLDLVECFKYADDGPPPDVARQRNRYMGEVVPGWVVLSPDDGTGHRAARTGDDHHISDHAVHGNAAEVAASDTSTDAYGDRSPGDAATQRRADALAEMVADAIGADLFVTKRPYLRATTWQIANSVTIVDVDEALAVLGLYLRAQGQYVTYRSPEGRDSVLMNRGLFFWVGARELLPSAWRWFTACAQHSARARDDGLLLLGQSVLQRAQRALQMRDEVHVGLNKPQDNDTADEALSALDVVLLLLLGAVDATARVAHAVLGLTGPAHRAGWQRNGWVSEVAAAEPPLAALFRPGTDEHHTLTILRLLRNSIHGEAMQAVGVGRPRRRERTLVSLPASREPELRAALVALGGLASWGIEELVPGRLHFDPGVFLERLFPHVIEMLDRIMHETPVERLSHVGLQPEASLAPAGPDAGPFSEINRHSIRWQLGY
ncbi:MAG: hypothetical protein ACYCSX_18195 [Acidimicrobiales bacterium]